MAIITLYVSLIIGMFDPEMASVLKEFEKVMPNLMAAVGMTAEIVAAPVEQRFEAENVLANPEVLLRNKQQKGSWNLWSTDVDAAKKWSGGIVLQGILLTLIPAIAQPVVRKVTGSDDFAIGHLTTLGTAYIVLRRRLS